MKYFLLALVVSIPFFGFSQTTKSAATIQKFKQISQIVKSNTIDKELISSKLSKYPIYKVNGIYCLSTVARVENDFSAKGINPELFVGSRVGDIVTFKIPLNQITPDFSIPMVKYIEVAERIQAMNNKMHADVRADSVWEGIDLPKGYTGKNVLIGITDWGFDYGHPMFMDTTLSYSRVRAAWDQFKIVGNPPTAMGYGVEYATPAALANAQSDTAGAYYDYATHGSHVAGIAAGSGAGLKYRGVAFEAEYLFNSLQLDVGSAIDAFVWMKSIADTDGKRLVINMSWGLYYMGTMDGTSLVSLAINTLSDQGVVFATSAGNNGLTNFHIKKNYNNDSIRTRIGFYPYSAHPFMWGECITMWGQFGHPFSAKMEVYSSSHLLLSESPVFNTDINNGYSDSILVIGTDTVFYNFTIDSANPLNHRPHMEMRVKNTNTSYNIVLSSFAPSGVVHYWNVVELSNGVGNWGLDFYSYGNNGVAGDNQYGVGEPACAESAIAVAAHVSETVAPNGTVIMGVRAGFSSIGPTYDERMKPDISAPGNHVISSINSFTTASYTTKAQVTFNGKVYDFAAFSGTSMSSPALAGVAALVLEANPYLSSSQVKSILKSTARQDIKTGVISPPGNPQWGMGKVTATAAVALALNTVAIETKKQKSSVSLFPNPAYNQVTLQLESTLDENLTYAIYNIQGQCVIRGEFNNSIIINTSNWSEGMYFIKIADSDKSNVLKFIKL